MNRFSEAIKVKDGVFYNLSGHRARMNRTAMVHFGRTVELDLTEEMIPAERRAGLVKCRVEYDENVLSVEFIPYAFRTIRTVAVVRDEEIDYTYKSVDRSRLDRLRQDSGCDEVIIVKGGRVTDASSSNLVLEDASGLYTPADCLLSGTKRADLLARGVIRERVILEKDLHKARRIFLINAMIDLEDGVVVPFPVG
jgi:4-amino-4-deoxychorismate lyase